MNTFECDDSVTQEVSDIETELAKLIDNFEKFNKQPSFDKLLDKYSDHGKCMLSDIMENTDTADDDIENDDEDTLKYDKNVS